MSAAAHSPYGHPQVDSDGVRIPHSIATKTALKAIAATDPIRTKGNEVLVHADGSRWMFDSASEAADTSEHLVLTPAAGSGRWLRCCGTVDLSLAFTYATADAAVLFTVPVGARLIVVRGYWEITTACAGGSSSAIGLSGPSPHNTKGDLLGGASGDVEATLTAGVKLGTIGADQAVGILLKAADTVKFDRVTSVFTSGAGNAHLVCQLVANPGA